MIETVKIEGFEELMDTLSSGGIPEVTSNGKVLTSKVTGTETSTEWKDPDDLVNSVPAPTLADDGKVLTANEDGTYEWAESSGGGVAYSTTEHAVGTWIDGRTVYEKTLQVTGSTNTNFSTAHGISNLNYIISVDGMMIFATDVVPFNGNGEARVGVYNTNSTSIFIFSGNAYGTSNATFYVTLRYVKATV